MPIDYTSKRVELRGGSVYLYKIPDSVVATPSTYAPPNAVIDVDSWAGPTAPDALSYVSLGATDGNTVEITPEFMGVQCDQTLPEILKEMTAIEATVTCVLEEHLAWRIAVGMGLDFGDTGDLTAADIFSPLLDAEISRSIAYVGDLRGSTFYDLRFEKFRTNDKTKILGWWLPKTQCTSGLTFAYKHGETDFYELKFTGLAFDFVTTPAQGFYNEVAMYYEDAV